MGLLDTFLQSIQDLNPEWTKDRLKTAAGLLADFTPVVGDIKAGYDMVDSARQGNYGEAALNGLGLLPFIPAMGGVMKASKPLTKDQFYREYAQHIDLRGRDGSAEKTLESITKDGFKKGSGPNALPPSRGGKPMNIVEMKFAPQVGDYVYLAPKDSWKSTKFGMQIQDGWKPSPNEVIKITDENVGKSAYEMYLDALKANK